jgi:hypothetical protein
MYMSATLAIRHPITGEVLARKASTLLQHTAPANCGHFKELVRQLRAMCCAGLNRLDKMVALRTVFMESACTHVADTEASSHTNISTEVCARVVICATPTHRPAHKLNTRHGIRS